MKSSKGVSGTNTIVFVFFVFITAAPLFSQPLFEEVAVEMNLTYTQACGGAFWFDYDNDGDQDICRSQRFIDPVVVYRNDRTQFVPLSANIGLPQALDGGRCIPMDFDHDGDFDLLIDGYSTPVTLLVNENGVYSNQTTQRGLGSNYHGRSLAWLDLNNDGWIDILLQSREGWKAYRNNGGTFTDITASTLLPNLYDGSHFSECDYDLDGYVDLFMTRLSGSDHLYKNLGGGVFTDVTVPAGLSGVSAELGCTWADFDKDKYPDILTQNETLQRHTIWHNNGDGTFTEMNVHGTETNFAAGGSPYGAFYNVADFDLDGDCDFYTDRPAGCVNHAPNQLFHMDRVEGMDIWFTDIAPQYQMNMMADGFGVWGDIENDGDLDLYVAMPGEPDKLFRNNTVNSGNHFEIRALGPAGEQDRWHTRVELYLHGSSQIVQTSELNSSNVNCNGFNNYFTLSPDGHYDLRLFFTCGVTMGPEDYPYLSDVVPSQINHLLTVYMGQTSAVPGKPTTPANTFRLTAAYPNPFNAVTNIRYELAESGPCRLAVYDLSGRHVADLVDGIASAGEHSVAWNAAGQASGVYFLRLTSGSRTAYGKIMLIR